MAKIETQYVLVGRDQTQRAFRSLRGNVRRAERAVFSLQGAFAALGATAAIRSIAQVGIQFEQIERSLQTTSGSAEAANDNLRFLRSTAEELGLDLLSTAEAFTRLSAATKGSVVEGQQTRELFLGVSQAARSLGLSADDTAGILRQFGQIAAKGRAQTEELITIAERGIPIYELLAEATGKSRDELNDLLQKGKLGAETVLPALATSLQDKFGAAAEAAGDDAQAAFNRFNNTLVDVQRQLAEGGLLDGLADLATFLGDVATNGVEAARGLGEFLAKITTGTSSSDYFVQQRDRAVEIGEELRNINQEIAKLEGRGDIFARLSLGNLEERRQDLIDELRGIGDELGSVRVRVPVKIEPDIQEIDLSSLPDRLGVSALTVREVTVEAERLTDAITIDRSTRLGWEEYTDMVENLPSEMREVNQAAQELGFTFESAFENAIIEGENLRSVMRGLIQDIARLLIRGQISGLFANIFSSAGGGSGGGSFSGFFASGGFIKPGQFGVVGEDGPEFAFGGKSGATIVPQGASGGDVYINTTVNGTNLSQPQLLAALEANNQRVLAEVSQRRREGRL